jgi:hypothetical protein
MPTETIVCAAYADLVGRAFLELRNRTIKEEDQIHDLGDALHNVSGVLVSHGAWIEDEEYRRLYLRPYDTRWRGRGLMLESFLQERVEFHSKKEANQVPEPMPLKRHGSS